MSPAERGRRPRPIGVAILALVALVALFVIASLSLDEGNEDRIEITGAQEVQRLVGGIQQDDRTLGEKSAPVTIQVFNDLQCTPCADYQREVVDELIANEVRAGEVKLEFHHFSTGARSTGIAAYGAVAAGLQDDQWQFIELFVRNQDEAQTKGVTDEFLQQVANAILEFNVAQWQRDFDEPEVKEAVDADVKTTAEMRLPAQPAVVVEGPLGARKLIESPSLAEIRDAVAEVTPSN